MAEKKQIEIKESILKTAMELWGITEENHMDPVVDLLLDVFAYEIANLHLEIEQSDSRIMKQLSQVLIDSKWSSPYPAHALMSIYPASDELIVLEPEDQFYTEKIIFEKDKVQLLFTPLFQQALVKTKIHLMVYDTVAVSATNKGFISTSILKNRNRIDDYTQWIGLTIPDAQLSRLNELTLCLIPEDAGLLPFFRMVRCFDVNGNELSVDYGLHQYDSPDQSHYYNEIIDFYSDYYMTVSLSPAAKQRKPLSQLLSNALPAIEEFDEQLVWLKVVLPEIVSYEQLKKLRIYTNTFPVINRKLVYKQHSFVGNGRIIPLTCPSGTHFLNVHTVQDDMGNTYVNRLKQFEVSPSGVYSPYFSELERFDADNARTLIDRVLQLIREDGNAFMAMNPDIVATQLKDLFNKLDDIEKHLARILDTDHHMRAFLLTVPKSGATHAEVKYWVTNGEMANGLDERTFIQQFNMGKYDAANIVFRTRTRGGNTHQGESDLIHSLRYGLLSRDRIVSRGDIHSYIMHKIGRYVETVDIKNGVAISEDRKKGLVRTTEILIKMDKRKSGDMQDLHVLAHFLEKDLASRSINDSKYNISFI